MQIMLNDIKTVKPGKEVEVIRSMVQLLYLGSSQKVSEEVTFELRHK